MIPYGRQDISDEDIEAVVAVLRSDFITQGPSVTDFEQSIAKYCGSAHAIAVNSATSALHIACLALGVGPGDLVWTSPITFVASSNCALYCGADVDFVDVDDATANMSVDALAAKLAEAETAGRLPKVVIPVHLCGTSCDMKAIRALGDRYGFRIIEDASHAIGGHYLDAPVGSCAYSEITVFSFHPVKIITTGEGGMVVTADAELARKVRLLKGQGMDPNRRYWFPVTGYNYRMTNIAAAIGLGQLERISWHLSRRREIAAGYTQRLSHCPQLLLPPEKEWAHNAYWIYSVVLTDTCVMSRDDVMAHLAADGIETRPFFVPMHSLPMFATLARGEKFPVADRLAARGINLPSSASLSEEDQTFVCERLLTLVQG